MARLRIEAISELRANSAPLPTQIAATVDCDAFKSPANKQKPESKSVLHHFSKESRNFKGSALKKTANKVVPHQIIPLGTGRPLADFHPWESVSFESYSPSRLKSHDSLNEVGVSTLKTEKRGGVYDLATALNYGNAAGAAPLLRFFIEHIELVHDPPHSDWATCLTSCTTAALETALRIFCNKSDTVLAERYTYPGFLEVAFLLGLKIHGIEMDYDGLIPEKLNTILEQWDDANHGIRPRVLYTIPSGQNPTGITQSLARRKALYQIAEKFNLIILEDDAYCFLQTTQSDTVNGTVDNDFTSVPSYMSLDTSGRVVRFDSVPKVLSPGLRMGSVSGSKQIIEKFLSYHEVSTVSVAGLTQLALVNLLDHTWGHEGYFAWLIHLSEQYRIRLQIMSDACKRYLPSNVCEWQPPQHGMFLWITLRLDGEDVLCPRDGKESTEPLEASFIADLESRISKECIDAGVQITCGSIFDTQKEPGRRAHMRLTFAAALESDLDPAVRRIANVIRGIFDLELM